MAATIHSNARTTPKIRQEIQAAPSSVTNVALAWKYGLTKHTVAKWRNRSSVEDGSHRPNKLHTTLTEAQEAVVVSVREMLLLSLDDLLVIAREFLNPNLSRSALDRCLRRHGVSSLKTMLREQGEASDKGKPTKTFKDYAPGFVHFDVKYLPQMQDERSRGYLFVAIDRATRWVYLEIRRDKSAKSAKAFLNKVIKAAPFKISKVLTDNGKEFTDRFSTADESKPTGDHLFDQVCKSEEIEHRLTKPRRWSVIQAPSPVALGIFPPSRLNADIESQALEHLEHLAQFDGCFAVFEFRNETDSHPAQRGEFSLCCTLSLTLGPYVLSMITSMEPFRDRFIGATLGSV